MIDDALKLIRDEVHTYIDLNKESFDDSTIHVNLQNIASLEDTTIIKPGHIIISLVNIEEESILKNSPFRRTNPSGVVEYINPPVHLNLYILFACTVATDGESYRKSLSRLGLIIQFFQSKNCFTLQNSPAFAADFQNANQIPPGVNELRLTMELYTLTFEQINHLWGSLGGKQVPFAMYKARLVKIQEDKVQKGGGLITEINGELLDKKPLEINP